MAKDPQNPGFDPTAAMREMWSLYDPAKVSEMLDPQKFAAQLQAMVPGNLAAESVMSQSRQQFEAMLEANKAAVATYRDLVEKQMEIFNKLAKVATDSGSAGDKADYSAAMQTAFGLMQDLAENTRNANEKVFQEFQTRVNEAVDRMKAGS